jgi:hypothetical protein
MPTEITEVVVRQKENHPPDFADLLISCLKPKPDKKDLQELRKYLTIQPGLLSESMGLAVITQTHLTSKIVHEPASKMAVEDDINVIQKGLGMDQAPMLEKLLIQNVVNTWLRLQWVEYQLAGFMNGESTREQIAWWEKRLSITQGRYLRAIETLARVRKIALPDLQINVASEGGQQVNVAGDLRTGK